MNCWAHKHLVMDGLQNLTRDFESLLECRVEQISKIGGGRNSQVFKVVCHEGRQLVAKKYHISANDPRDRLNTEFSAFNFLWQNGVHQIPEPYFTEPAQGIAFYEFIDGNTFDTAPIEDTDIDATIAFLASLEKLKTLPAASQLPPASEACFSLSALLENLSGRYARLAGVPTDAVMADEFHLFLENELYLTFNDLKRDVSEIGLLPGHALDEKDRILSPSDFGFHNAIRRPNDQLVFLDFEYFGWDDPVKTISDFILHPGMNLNQTQKLRFAQKAFRLFGGDKGLCERFELLFPFFVLKWCAILLNEFTSTDMERRKFAGNDNGNIAEIRKRQLEKSQKMLNEVNRKHVWTKVIN